MDQISLHDMDNSYDNSALHVLSGKPLAGEQPQQWNNDYYTKVQKFQQDPATGSGKRFWRFLRGANSFGKLDNLRE